MVWQVVVVVVSAFIFAFRINSFPLHNWDEAWYAEISRNLTSGNYSWLVPFWNGQYYFDKPPLYFLLSWPFFKFFGAGEWQARIVSVLAAVGATLLVYLIGKKLFNQKVGLFSAVVFLSLGQVVSRFSQGNLDALLVFYFLATFYFFLLSREKKIFVLLSGIFLGGGFLVKGWFLGLFPAAWIIVYSFFQKKKILPEVFFIFFISLLLYSGYLFLGWQQFGQRFLDWYLFTPTADNLLGQFQALPKLLTTFLRDLGFWFLLVLFILFHWRKIVWDKKEVFLSLLATAILFLSSLQFLENFFGWYLLPAYPLVALLLGYLLERLVRKENKLVFVIIVFIFISQALLLIKVQGQDKDRSVVTAELGKVAKEVVSPGETLILDDPDFSSFLFYSKHQVIYVLHETGGRQGEWWIIRKNDLSLLFENQSHAWLISQNPQDLPIRYDSDQIIATKEGYQFLKLK